MTWIAWVNVLAYPVVLSVLVSAFTAWAVRRSMHPRLAAVEQALVALAQQPATAPGLADQLPSPEGLLDQDPHARYRRPASS